MWFLVKNLCSLCGQHRPESPWAYPPQIPACLFAVLALCPSAFGGLLLPLQNVGFGEGAQTLVLTGSLELCDCHNSLLEVLETSRFV